MLRRINRYRLAGRTCCVVKYKADNRYDDTKVATHDLLVLLISFKYFRGIFYSLVFMENAAAFIFELFYWFSQENFSFLEFILMHIGASSLCN